MVKYANGDLCPAPYSGPRTVSVIVACGSGTATGYQVVYGKNPCDYIILMKNQWGCGTSPPPPPAFCNVTLNGQTFDLSSLESSTDYMGADSQYTYRLAVCESAHESTCNQRGGNFCQYSPSGFYVHMLSLWDSSAECKVLLLACFPVASSGVAPLTPFAARGMSRVSL